MKLILTIIMGMGSMLLASNPFWTVNRSAFENNMTVTSKVILNGMYTDDANDSLAVFVNGECRGVAGGQYVAVLDQYYFFLLVSSNETSNENLSFKFYDASANAILDLSDQFTFEVGQNKGNIDMPYVFQDHSESAEILAYEFANVNESVTIDPLKRIVLVDILDQSYVNELKAIFSLSNGATAKVNNDVQYSNQSVNTFADTVVYEVVSASGSITNIWKVKTINGLSTGVEDQKLLKVNVYPNPTSEKIQVSNVEKGTFYELYNLQGKVIQSGNYSGTIELMDLAKGNYILKIKSASFTVVKQ